MVKMKKLVVNKIVELKNHYDFEAPMLPAAIPAGLSPDQNEQLILDLNKYLAPKPGDTYLVRVNGESMIDENIFDGDILVVDANEKPRDGKIVIAALNGEMTVKKYREIDGRVYLYSANRNFLPIEIEYYMAFRVQGVVKHVIHRMV